MLRQAIACDDPVIFYEPKRGYWNKAEVPEDPGDLPRFEHARVVRAGTDVTVLTYGGMVDTCLAAAEVAETERRSLQVVDLRSLSPLDMDTITTAVTGTGRCVVAHEAPTFAGFGAEIGTAVSEHCFYHLEAPVLRVGGYNTPYPPARFEDRYLPDLDRVLDAVDRSLAW